METAPLFVRDLYLESLALTEGGPDRAGDGAAGARATGTAEVIDG